jgi:hypothetical protein
MVLDTDRPVLEGGTELRGFLAAGLEDSAMAHHHLGDEQLVYSYPLVQYKVLGGVPQILGVDDGVSLVRKMVPAPLELTLGGSRYFCKGGRIEEGEYRLGDRPDPLPYSFASPWIGLNQENYRLYRTAGSWKDKKLLLNRILVGNILSMCKGLRAMARGRLEVHSRLNEVSVRYKGVPHIAFTGDFQVNFQIPDLMGVGKGASRGFGVVVSRGEPAQEQWTKESVGSEDRQRDDAETSSG